MLSFADRLALLRDEAHAVERLADQLYAEFPDVHPTARARLLMAVDHQHNAVSAFASARTWAEPK